MPDTEHYCRGIIAESDIITSCIPAAGKKNCVPSAGTCLHFGQVWCVRSHSSTQALQASRERQHEANTGCCIAPENTVECKAKVT